jgi:hypothetical protein
MIALDKRRDGVLEDMNKVGDLALELGVELNDNAKDKAAAAVGIWLLDGFVDELPGGYDKGKIESQFARQGIKKLSTRFSLGRTIIDSYQRTVESFEYSLAFGQRVGTHCP